MSIRVATSNNTANLLSGVYESGVATSSSAGLVRLHNQTGSGTDGTMTQASLTNALNSKESVSNKGVASGYCGLDSNSKVATTNLPTATSSTIGVMKLYDTVGTNTDGTMTQSAIKAYVEQAVATVVANLMTETSETVTIDVDTNNNNGASS